MTVTAMPQEICFCGGWRPAWGLPMAHAGGAYRIGGDEFVVLYRDCTEAELTDCLSGILEELRRSNEGKKLACIAAVGAAWSDEMIDLEELVREADRRMYIDKQSKKRENR